MYIKIQKVGGVCLESNTSLATIFFISDIVSPRLIDRKTNEKVIYIIIGGIITIKNSNLFKSLIVPKTI